MKASSFIHFSRTSQPPRLTPRRNGMPVLDGMGARVEVGLVDVGAADEMGRVMDGVGIGSSEVVGIEVGKGMMEVGRETLIVGIAMLVVGIVAVVGTLEGTIGFFVDDEEREVVFVRVLVVLERVWFPPGFPVGR